MSFPRYPHYKDSGTAGLGKIPSHWEVKPLKHLAAIDSCGSYGVEVEEAEIALPVATTAQIDADGRFAVDRMPVRGFVPAEVQRFGCSYGDILVVKSSGSATNIISGKAGLVDESTPPFVFSNFLMRVRPSRELAIPKFIYALLRSQLTRQRVEQMCSTTTYPNLQVGEYCSAPLPIPPLPEQTQIAAFLDRETAKIDELVAEQRRLMELLKEKRQAVISHAVTQGLNSHAPMKPSGIEWLGDLPAHWEISRIANVFREVAEPGTDELPILSVSIHHGVSDKEIDEEDMDRKVTRSDDRSKYKQVAPGDLVYNMMRAWQGGFGTVAVAGMVSPAYVVARPLRQIETAYIEHLLRTPPAIEQMRRHSRGVTDFRLRLYWDEFKNIRVALPPQEEAIAICAKIAEMEERFGAMSAACEESIDLLQERRTALISAAVTGQIDVCHLTEREAA